MTTSWMIYGAYGYTGELIARHAVEQGERPILAGRNAERIAALATELGLESVAFSLDDTDTLNAQVAKVDAVVHAAGPFSRTSTKTGSTRFSRSHFQSHSEHQNLLHRAKFSALILTDS